MSVEATQVSSVESVDQLVDQAKQRDSAMFTEAEGKALLAAFNIDVPMGVELELNQVAPEYLQDPLVVKAISRTLVHKSDVGGVKVGVTKDQLAQVQATMAQSLLAGGHDLEGLLVEEMAPAGHEVIVGAVRTPGIGWIVMVGMGGVMVEVFEDVAFGVAPLQPNQIRDMLAELQGMAILQGARGGQQANIDLLVDLLSRFAGPEGLLSVLPDDVQEIDLNPIIVSEDRAVAVDARFVVGDPIAGADTLETKPATDFAPLFRPQRVAVLGASGSKPNIANRYIRSLIANGYTGDIIPVHPHAESIEGFPTAASLADVGETIDYAYVALPGARVAESLAAGAGKVRFAQVISSGFGEVAEGQELEAQLVDTVRKAGIRLIGPNCLGTHTSPGKVSFIPEAPMTSGSTAVVSQSGGLSVDILRHGSAAGINFHSVISIGNSADISAGELVAEYLSNDEVRVIGLYLESLEYAREVLDVLAASPIRKPMVLLAGGRTAEGSRAASSHTGALTGNHRLWPAVARQAGITLVDTINEFSTALHALSTVDMHLPSVGHDVVLFGNGGGASVLAADALDREGLATPILPQNVIDELEALDVPPGNGFANPIDVPAGTLAVKKGFVTEDIFNVVLNGVNVPMLITHLNVGIIQRNLGATLGDVTGNIITAIGKFRAETQTATHQILVLKGDGSDRTAQLITDYSARARKMGIPVFANFEDAALAARAVLSQHNIIHNQAK